MFEHRRISLGIQKELLRRGLPNSMVFKGAFDKTGNYAVESDNDINAVSAGILSALREHSNLADLQTSEIFLCQEQIVHQALQTLKSNLLGQYGNRFNVYSYGVQINGAIWRAGMTFLHQAVDLQPFLWPQRGEPRTRVLGSSGAIAFFLKREESDGESRISFGDPTAAIECAMLSEGLNPMHSTSRSLRTVSGLLRFYHSLLR